MQTKLTDRQIRPVLMRLMNGLLCVCLLGVAGCGSGDSGNTPVGGNHGAGNGTAGSGGNGGAAGSGADRSADFALKTDPASKNAVIKPGQTVPLTVDLISINGYPNTVTLHVKDVPAGWATTFTPPSVSSLPKGITKVIVNVTVPADTAPGSYYSGGKISATSGSVSRYLNGGNVYVPSNGGDLNVTVSGLALQTYASGISPFTSPFAFTTGDLIGNIPLNGAGLIGPVTVALTNSNPGLTATVVMSTFVPENGVINSGVQIKLHIDPSVAGGAYPLTLTATAADGTKVTSTFSLYIQSAALSGFPTLVLSSAAGSTASVGVDLTVSGAPGAVVNLTIPDAPTGISVTVAPTSVTIPPSGTIVQHLTLQGRTLQKTSLSSYGASLVGTFADGSSQVSGFVVRVN